MVNRSMVAVGVFFVVESHRKTRSNPLNNLLEGDRAKAFKTEASRTERAFVRFRDFHVVMGLFTIIPYIIIISDHAEASSTVSVVFTPDLIPILVPSFPGPLIIWIILG